MKQIKKMVSDFSRYFSYILHYSSTTTNCKEDVITMYVNT